MHADTFDSFDQYEQFRDFVMRKSRHLLDDPSHRFIQAVVKTSAKRERTIEKGSILWRAQLGIVSELVMMPRSLSLNPDPNVEMVEIEMPRPLESKRMVPLKDRAGEGRVNPKGIPCLYLSTDRDTAMTEVRPWIGSGVSVGQFIVLRALKLVDCSMDSQKKSIGHREAIAPTIENRVWERINRAFSEPVTRSDDIAEYASTQILAEAFRNAGYDGLVYGSKLGIGKTVAAFDLTAAELVNCEGFRVESVKLEFSEAATMYCTDKYCDTDDGEIRDPTNPGYRPKRSRGMIDSFQHP